MKHGRLIAGAILVILTLGYPLLVFAGLQWSALSVRELAIGIGIVVALRVAFGASQRGHGAPIAMLAVAWGVPIALATYLDSELSLRLVPAMINAGMFGTFAWTLTNTPMIERFARAVDPDLGAAQQRHCRQFTVVWCVFLAVNGAVALASCFGPRSFWALYNGLLSYIAMGGLFAVEFVIRRVRFREYSDAFYDRILRRLVSMLFRGERWPNA